MQPAAAKIGAGSAATNAVANSTSKTDQAEDQFYWLGKINRASAVMLTEERIVAPEMGRKLAKGVAFSITPTPGWSRLLTAWSETSARHRDSNLRRAPGLSDTTAAGDRLPYESSLLRRVDMKIAVLLTAVALASGSALAASNSSNYDSDTPKTQKAPVVKKDKPAHVAKDAQQKEGVVDKTTGAIRHVGEKMGHATERLPGNHASNQQANDPSRTETSRSDTRGMGAASADNGDRRQRMDEAYNNWHTRQK